MMVVHLQPRIRARRSAAAALAQVAWSRSPAEGDAADFEMALAVSDPLSSGDDSRSNM